MNHRTLSSERLWLLPLLALFLAFGGPSLGQTGPEASVTSPSVPEEETGASGPEAVPSLEPVPPVPPAPPVPPIPPFPPSDGGDVVRFGAPIRVAPGDTHQGDIVVFGGRADIEGTQIGDVVVFGGTVEASGEIDGDVVAIGGAVHLASTAKISGDVVSMGGQVDREEGATIGGDSVSVAGPWGGKGPHGGDIAWALFPFLGIGAFTLGFLVWFIKVAWILIVTLVVLALLPNQVETAGEYLKQHWLKCLAAGFVSLIASFILGAVLCCTIVAPIALLIGYKVAKYFGLAVLFLVVGRALGRAVAHRELGIFAGLLVGVLVLGVLGFVSAAWWFYSFFGVGCAILTRFGTMKPWFPKRQPIPPPVPSVPVPTPEPMP